MQYFYVHTQTHTNTHVRTIEIEVSAEELARRKAVCNFFTHPNTNTCKHTHTQTHTYTNVSNGANGLISYGESYVHTHMCAPLRSRSLRRSLLVAKPYAIFLHSLSIRAQPHYTQTDTATHRSHNKIIKLNAPTISMSYLLF